MPRAMFPRAASPAPAAAPADDQPGAQGGPGRAGAPGGHDQPGTPGGHDQPGAPGGHRRADRWIGRLPGGRWQPRQRVVAAGGLLVAVLIVAAVAVTVTSSGGRLRGRAVALDPAGAAQASALDASGAPRAGNGGTGAAAAELARLLIAPGGFVALRPDAVSGPVRQPDELRRVLPDAGMDAGPVVALGLVQGYARAWRAAQTVTDPYDPHLPPPTIMTAAVLRFSSPQAAAAALRLIREHGKRGGETEFPVPTAGGYGTFRRVASTAQQYRYGVLWTHGTDLLDLAVSYPQSASPTQVVGFATAQDRALRG